MRSLLTGRWIRNRRVFELPLKASSTHLARHLQPNAREFAIIIYCY